MPDLEKMCRFERDIEKVLEDACEKDGWICTVAISPDGVASMFVEKFGGVRLRPAKRRRWYHGS